MAEVRFEHVSKAYTDRVTVIDDLNLHVRDHEFLVLVGPSGCGKSTALRLIAGLEEVSAGQVYIGARRVNDVAPKDRDIAMVFQNYALYPQMSVYDNLAFSLRLRHLGHAVIEERVQRAATLLGIAAYLPRKPRELSGGQRQRVALGRALVRQPQVYLLDEPLSNLDAKLRVQTRAEISRLHQATGTTFVYVTHDQIEAMTMGDRIAVLNAGVIQQLGTPQALYDTPANLFVAGFIGSPAMNFFHARLVGTDAGVAVVLGTGEQGPAASLLGLTGPTADALRQHASGAGRAVIVGIRPEDLRLAGATEPGGVTGVVEVVEHLGNEQLVYASVAGATAVETAPAPSAAASEAPSTIARLPADAAVRMGETVRLAVATSRLHIFDPTTTQRLA